MLYLKQSTSVTLKIGPFIDDTDGKTAETGLTEHQADIRISKNGANIIQKNEASSCTHDELGIYDCPIDDTDTNTLGRLQLWCHEAGFLPVFHEYTVLAANVFDALVGGGDYLDVATAELANIDFGATMKTSLDTIGDTVITNSTIHTDVGTAITNIGTLQTMLTDIHDTDLLDIHNDVGTQSTAIIALNLDVTAVKAITDLLTLAAIADAVHDETTEVGMTLRKATNIILAALAGKSTGGGTNTIKFKDQADTKFRITATVTADGDRTAITNDGA